MALNTDKARSFMHFDNLGYLTGQTVTNATLWLYNWYSHSCQASTTNIYQVSQAWTGSGLRTYPGAALGALAGSASFADGYPGCVNGPGWVGFNITATVAGWAANGGNNLGLAVVSPNETDNFGWKKFYSWNQGNGGAGAPTPHIDITYNTAATAPAPPTNAYDTPANNSANITWNLSPSDGGAAIDSYWVNAFDGNTGAYVTQASCPGQNCQSLTIGGLLNNHPYYFGVYAHNAVNFSMPPDYTGTIYPTAPPGTPQGVVATPGNGSATMVWAPPVPNGTSPVTGYAVLAYYTNNTYSGHYAVVCATCYTAAVTGLTNGTAYNLFVFAGNAPNNYGPGAESGPVTPNVNVPTAPTTPTAFAPGVGSIGLYWYPSGSAGTAPITQYAVNTYDLATGFVATSVVVVCPCGAAMYTSVTGLTAGHGYFFALYAYNSSGYGPDTITAVTSSNPATPAPSSVVASGGNAIVKASWIPPVAQGTSAITGYLLGSVDQATGTVISLTVNCPCTNPVTATVTGMTNGHTYQIVVYAQNITGYGSPGTSNIVTASGPQAPGAPTNVNATAGDSSASVTWSPSRTTGSSVTTYTVTSNPDGRTSSTPDGSVTSATVGGLTNGTPYTFTVIAHSAAGDSAVSGPSNIVTPGPSTTTTTTAPTTTTTLPATTTTTAPTATTTAPVTTTTVPSTTTTTVPTTSGPHDPPPPPQYVAAGDSYSSGEGAPQGSPPFIPPSDSDGCDRSTAAYSQVFAQAHPEFATSFVACSGAVTDNVIGTDQHPPPGGPGDTPGGQSSVLGPNTNLVTMTIGGNDAGFKNFITNCEIVAALPPGLNSCRNDPSTSGEPAVIQGIQSKLSDTYSKVRTKAPNAAIFVLNYPHLVTNTNRNLLCVGDGSLTTDPDNIDYINQLTDQLDQLIATTAANFPGVQVLDSRPAFAGHEICTPDAWVNGITPSNIVFSFHPKVSGQQAYFRTLNPAVVEQPPIVNSVTPVNGPDNTSSCSTQVTLSGANFTPGTTVLFGGTPSASVNVISANQLTAFAPPLPAGNVPVTVQTNRGLNFGTSTTTIGSYFTYLPDTTAPTGSAASNPAPNGAGWNNTNPTVTITGNDGPCGSGVRSITYSSTGAQTIPTTTVNAPTAPITITAEGTTTISYSAIDKAGNSSGSTATYTVKLDKTPPANVTVSTDRSPDKNGWYNHPFVASWSGTDSLSGLASCTSTTYSGPDTTGSNLPGTCTDVAGNVSPPVTLAFKYDATPPVNVHGVADRPPDSNGWYNHPITLAFTGSDATSGIDTCNTTTYSGPDVQGGVINGGCTDKSGNTTTANFTVNYDHTPPTAQINGNAVQSVASGVLLTGTAADNLSGVASIKVSFADLFGLLGTTTRQATCTSGCGTPAATWSVSTGCLLGIYSATATATDIAGNVGPASNSILLAVA